jgi:hypothetical protein
MDRLAVPRFDAAMTTTHTTPRPSVQADPDAVLRAISRRSFCTLATTSPGQRPHVAGVLYAMVDGDLYISTLTDSRKARNIADNPHVFVCVPVRRLPVGPPSTVQFAATAEVLSLDHPDLLAAAGTGCLKAITGHGELSLPGGCFLRIRPASTVHTYGLGLSLRRLIKDPLHAGGRVTWPR